MQWDRKRVDAILAQSDSELLPKAKAVMEALGLSAETQAKVLSDLPGLREKASEVSEMDFYKARMLLGEEELARLVAMLEKGNG